MISNRYRLIIFDWDGTLMDSARKIVTCFQAAAQDCDLPVPDTALIEHQIGLTLEIAWSNIFSALGIPEDTSLQHRVSDRYRDHFLELDNTPMPLYEGVVEGLTALEESGYLLAIATGKARRGLERAMLETDLQKHFVYSRCSDEAFSKPHPKMLLDILDYCGCDADSAVMVGDTIYDMQMAINAGVDSLAVSYGVHKKEMLAPMATLDCAEDFGDFLRIIEQSEGSAKV